jgi:transposase
VAEPAHPAGEGGAGGEGLDLSRGGFTSKLHLSADPDSIAADKGYSDSPCREYLRCRGIRHTIPEKTDSQAVRLRKGSRGGRPPGFNEERYKKCNTIERAISRLKQSRAVAGAEPLPHKGIGRYARA